MSINKNTTLENLETKWFGPSFNTLSNANILLPEADLALVNVVEEEEVIEDVNGGAA
jgi:hypothetical protein